MVSIRWMACAFALVVVLGAGTTPATAGEDGEGEQPSLSEDERRTIVNELEHGIHALRKLGMKELAAHLLEIARDVARGGEGRSERRMVERHVEIIKSGVPILVEAGRSDAAEQLERAAHARELMLAGRKDAEAARIREGAPDHGQLAELLTFAAHHAEKQGKAKQAGWLAELGQHFLQRWKQAREGVQPVQREKKRVDVPADEIGLLRKAMDALLEAGKRDRAHRVEQALHWRRMRAQGDAQAGALGEARRRAPTPKQLAAQLRFAADLWQGFGQPEMRRALDAFAARLESPRGSR